MIAVESWGPWFLWALFAVILVWEEVWDLPNSAYLSAWLLLIITAGALSLSCSMLFQDLWLTQNSSDGPQLPPLDV